ncbi:hypothetical protein AYL99_11111 [Fonsecaea erecta]|uniref:HORMA domain-containing protein n=1 Tax=Fonsecaea erecta TaxID=1367422 RepID=A0A178Z653_9EURO|nr:hypothetical protein AYL99_11111 [Fonsecaea erecta]OAP54663.1 hypothetical protein AYL99_11111 [Fonsecaea erecta]
MAQQILLAPPSERTLSQAESLAVVQIFLNASLACIAHTRELIPWTSPCFRKGYIGQITLEDDPSAGGSLYSAFQALTPEIAGEGQEIKLLVRGGHRRADQILDMLEKGVFDALHRTYLDSLRVFVTNATESQPMIVETYHFAFAYEQGRVTGVRLDPVNHAFVLENAHKSFKAAIRALLRSLRDLPRLPARRKLGMSLTYNETCPMPYQPPGFVDKDDYQEGEGQIMCEALLKRDEDVVGVLECGHQQVRVAVSVQSSIDLQDTEMSRQLQAMQKTSSSHSNNLVSTWRDSFPGAKRPRTGPIPRAKRLRASSSGKPSNNEPVPQEVSFNIPTGSQRLEKPTFASPELGQRSASKDHSAPTSSPKGSCLCLRISKLTELLIHCYAIQSGKTGGNENAFDQGLLAEGKIKRLSRSSRINCECGSQQKSSSMLYCEVCDGWQHSKCYGCDESLTYTTWPEHFCYTCLLFSERLDPPTSPLLIILLRTAVSYLTTETIPGAQIDEKFLQTRLKPSQYTPQALDRTMERLVEERVVMPRADGSFEVRLLSDSEMWQVKERCMRPLASIGGFYETCADVEDRHNDKDLTRLLKAYARGNDYTTAEECEKLTEYDDFGNLIVRWGYRFGGLIPTPRDSIVQGRTATPVRRRKVSISRILINIDRSPSAASMSFEESTSGHPNDWGYDTDFSTATAD